MEFYAFDKQIVITQSMKRYLVQTIGITPEFVEMQQTHSFYVLFPDVDAAEKFLFDYYSSTATKIKQQTPTLILKISLCFNYHMFPAIKNYIKRKLSVYFFFTVIYE